MRARRAESRRMRPGFTRSAAALVLLVATTAYVCAELLNDPTALGVHDWDAMNSTRLFVVDSIRTFGQMPYWDPYACGGYPAWSAPETATTVVSPMLVPYLLFSLATAVRIEIVATLAFGIVGMWLLASRACKDPLVKAAVCVVAMLNSRWALQAASGHAWHLYYAWFPWVLWAFLQARAAANKWPWLALGAACVGMMVYTGAIYPLSHALLAVACFALWTAVRKRTIAPLLDAAAVAIGGAALAAPKLFPTLENMARFPRHVESSEYMWPHQYLPTFFASGAGRGTVHVPGLDWGWHEYGIYVGVVGLAALAVGVWRAPRDEEVRALRGVGLFFMWLSLGLFGPWVVLHLVPPFRSQHVPTRFAYPGVMMLAVVAGASLEAALPKLRARVRDPRVFAAIGFASFAILAIPIARESRACLAGAFHLHLPPIRDRATYEQTYETPEDLAYADANGPPSLTTQLAHQGTILCSTYHGFAFLAWPEEKRPRGLGARGKEEPEYRGEAFVDGAAGTATIERFSPNEIVVDVRGATPGDWLVLNQNWDASWRANGTPTVARADTNAYKLASGDERVVFRYSPRLLPLAIGVAVSAFVAFAFAIARAGRRAARVAQTKSATSTA
jgi:hypothetical protein